MTGEGSEDSPRFPKASISARIQLRDGRWIEGRVFVSALTRRHAGTETLIDLIQQVDPYLPFAQENGEVLLLRKAGLARYEIDAARGLREIDPDDVASASTDFHPVTIRFLTGEETQGKVPLFTEGRRPARVLDWLNHRHACIPLLVGDRIQYVMDGAIECVREGVLDAAPKPS